MDELEPVPSNLRALLEQEKAGGEPSPDARERVLLRLTGTFAAGAPVGLPPGTGPKGSPVPGQHATTGSPQVVRAAAVGTAARVVRTAVVFLTGAASGVGGYHLAERSRRPPPASAPVVVPAARQEMPRPPEMPEPALPPTREPAPSASRVPLRTRTPSTAEAAHEATDRPDDPLAVERSLVEMARAALTRGQAERALLALRRHAQQFPKGELTEEREGLLVQALVAAQKYDQAREKADQFKQHYPRSLFAPVVDQAIGSIP
jgi:hypothetical protein